MRKLSNMATRSVFALSLALSLGVAVPFTALGESQDTQTEAFGIAVTTEGEGGGAGTLPTTGDGVLPAAATLAGATLALGAGFAARARVREQG